MRHHPEGGFDDTQSYKDLLKNAGKPRDPSPYFPDYPPLEIWNPGTVDGNTDRCLPYKKPDAKLMTVGGELNKLAANVAMGRSMGGVHWRTDNTRSLRLGEQISTIILSQLLPRLPENPSLELHELRRQPVTIAATGTVTVPADPALEAFYIGPF